MELPETANIVVAISNLANEGPILHLYQYVNKQGQGKYQNHVNKFFRLFYIYYKDHKLKKLQEI